MISVPPPLRLSVVPGLSSPIAPLTVSVLPAAAVTFRLLPSMTGAAIVWLPPLSLSVAAAPPVFDKVNMLPLLALIP